MNKSRYRELCQGVSDLPLYHQARWLDAVCGESWDVVFVEQESKLIAAWPFVPKKKLVFTAQVMPLLTQRLGIWLNIALTTPESRHELVNRMIELKPAADYEVATFPLGFDSSRPLIQRGYVESSRLTYIIRKMDAAQALANILPKTKSDIIKANKDQLVVTAECTGEESFKVIREHLIGKTGKAAFNEADFQTFLSKISFANPRFLGIRDLDKKLNSVIFLVEDQDCVYYLMSGSAGARLRGANTLLLSHAIEDAMKRGKHFDFEGSMVEGIARYFRSFGALPENFPSFKIYRSRLLRYYYEGLRS